MCLCSPLLLQQGCGFPGSLGRYRSDSAVPQRTLFGYSRFELSHIWLRQMEICHL